MVVLLQCTHLYKVQSPIASLMSEQELAIQHLQITKNNHSASIAALAESYSWHNCRECPHVAANIAWIATGPLLTAYLLLVRVHTRVLFQSLSFTAPIDSQAQHPHVPQVCKSNS